METKNSSLLLSHNLRIIVGVCDQMHIQLVLHDLSLSVVAAIHWQLPLARVAPVARSRNLRGNREDRRDGQRPGSGLHVWFDWLFPVLATSTERYRAIQN